MGRLSARRFMAPMLWGCLMAMIVWSVVQVGVLHAGAQLAGRWAGSGAFGHAGPRCADARGFPVHTMPQIFWPPGPVGRTIFSLLGALLFRWGAIARGGQGLGRC